MLAELTLTQGLVNRVKKAIGRHADNAKRISVTIATGTKEGYEKTFRGLNDIFQERKEWTSDLVEDHTVIIIGIPPLQKEK